MESFSAVCSVFGLTSVVEDGGIFTVDLTAGWECVKELTTFHWRWDFMLVFQVSEVQSLHSKVTVI